MAREREKMTYLELEDLCQNREICLFGAGGFGKTNGYNCLKCFGIKADFYCDNNILPGTVIRDGIEVRNIQYLYENKEEIQVFITVGEEYREEIKERLREHGIMNAVIVEWSLVTQVLDSIDVVGDKSIIERYHTIYNDEEYLPVFYEFAMGKSLIFFIPKRLMKSCSG